VKGFGLYERPILGFSHRKLLRPLQPCLELPRWHVMDVSGVYILVDFDDTAL
jgi:hypothetical protein